MDTAYNLPPIFVISLKNSPRREFMAKRLSGLGLQFEFFDAVYGKELSEVELAKVDYQYYQDFDNKRLTLGEIGCSLSHIRVYEHIKKNHIPEAIILEDDAIVSTHFKAILQSTLEKLPSRYEILFFDHGKAKSYPLIKKNLPEGYKLVRYRYPSPNSRRSIMKATAYMVNLAGVEKLLNYAYPVRMPADFVTGFIQKTRIHAYGIEPSCVFEGLATESEINSIEDRYKKHK